MNRNQIKAALLTDPKTAALLGEAKELLGKYQEHLDSFDYLLSPESARKRIGQLITESNDGAELEAARKMLMEAEHTTPDVIAVARRHAREVFEPARKALFELVDHVKTLLADFAAKAVDAETEFFAEHGLPVEATSVRKVPLQLVTEFEQYRAQVQGAGSYGLPNSRSEVIEWLK